MIAVGVNAQCAHVGSQRLIQRLESEEIDTGRVEVQDLSLHRDDQDGVCCLLDQLPVLGFGVAEGFDRVVPIGHVTAYGVHLG